MIKLIKSTFYNEEDTKKKLCDFILNADKLSMGEMCLEFEEKFSKYQGRKYSVFFNSGSSANLAMLQALVNLEIIKTGENIGFSALTWATNPMPILQLRLNPVPVDINIKTLNLSSKKLEEVLNSVTIKALFITNLLGFCDDLEKIKNICDEKKIILLEDNCESLGSELKGVRLGNFGLASTFSFFVGHHMSTIEGGMVCTDDKMLYDMLKMVRAHGWTRNLDNKKQDEIKKINKIDDFYNNYTFYVSAYNFRPTEINGFLGLNQLDYIEEMNEKRQDNFLRFKTAALTNKEIEPLELQHMSFISNFAYPVICKTKGSFEKYKQLFASDGVEIRPIVGGSMVEQPFFKKYSAANGLKFICPNAEQVHMLGFYFPNNPELTESEIQKLCLLIEK